MAKTKLGAAWTVAPLRRGGGAAAAAVAPAAVAAAAEEPITYSIKGQFAGATVLVTGASGYIGSVVLEQLLRTTDVAEVYLLLRARRGTDPGDRVAALLGSNLFHMVRR
jgi:NADPH:quinone reductase-like Zn-dependent oxidoreductase